MNGYFWSKQARFPARSGPAHGLSLDRQSHHHIPLKSWRASLLLNPIRIFTLKRLAIRPEQVQRGLRLDEQTERDRGKR